MTSSIGIQKAPNAFLYACTCLFSVIKCNKERACRCILTQVQKLKKELAVAQKSRKSASASLRMALQKAAQLRLMEKEKNKSPSYAMRISLQINKVVWGMLVDGKSFAEAEINDMVSLMTYYRIACFCFVKL